MDRMILRNPSDKFENLKFRFCEKNKKEMKTDRARGKQRVVWEEKKNPHCFEAIDDS